MKYPSPAKAARARLARIIGACVIATLLSLPAILRFPWTLSDYLIMGALLGSVGLGIDLVARLSGSVAARLGSMIAVLAAFLTIWVNLAVGMIGDGLAYNLLFALPPLVAFIGGFVVRLAPRNMVRLCAIAAGLQVIIALGGYLVDPRGALLSACFGLPWLLAASLFQHGTKGSNALQT